MASQIGSAIASLGCEVLLTSLPPLKNGIKEQMERVGVSFEDAFMPLSLGAELFSSEMETVSNLGQQNWLCEAVASCVCGSCFVLVKP